MQTSEMPTIQDVVLDVQAVLEQAGVEGLTGAEIAARVQHDEMRVIHALGFGYSTDPNKSRWHYAAGVYHPGVSPLEQRFVAAQWYRKCMGTGDGTPECWRQSTQLCTRGDPESMFPEQRWACDEHSLPERDQLEPIKAFFARLKIGHHSSDRSGSTSE